MEKFPRKHWPNYLLPSIQNQQVCRSFMLDLVEQKHPLLHGKKRAYNLIAVHCLLMVLVPAVTLYSVVLLNMCVFQMEQQQLGSMILDCRLYTKVLLQPSHWSMRRKIYKYREYLKWIQDVIEANKDQANVYRDVKIV